MKNKKLYTKLLLAGSLMLMSGGLTSCEDFLTIVPSNQLPEESFWQDKSDLEGVLAGAYQQLTTCATSSAPFSGVNTKILYWGEVRSDNFEQNDMTRTDITYMQDAVLQPTQSIFDWSEFYTGINYCNLILEQGEKMTEPGNEVDPGFTRSDWTVTEAETTALRALYYFYLVRAFRDVPYVTNAIRTDAEARSTKPVATPGVAILGQLIEEVEGKVDKAPTNFGNTADNCGRFTKRGAHALLADMYLWRGCLLKNFANKTKSGRVNISDVSADDESGKTTWTTADGKTVNSTYTDALAEECFTKAIEHSDWVLTDMKKEYDEDLELAQRPSEDEQKQPYPLILNSESFGSQVQSDNVFYQNFSNGNSTESIFELQYDGNTITNSLVTLYLTSATSSQLTSGYLAISNNLISNASTVDPTVGFGKTDFRLLESCNIMSTEGRKPITKYAVQSVATMDTEDMTGQSSSTTSVVSSSYRTSSDAHFHIYRLTDVMLMKAEAIARKGNPSATEIEEGYLLTNQIFKRNNPGLVGTDDTGASDKKEEFRSDRCNDGTKYDSSESGDNYKTYVNNQTAAKLLSLVYRERQREFFAEGKRWFDLVRQVEYSNDPESTLTDYATVTTAVKTRLSQLYSFYNPIYSEELKVSGTENGGYLEQNPVWERYSKK